MNNDTDLLELNELFALADETGTQYQTEEEAAAYKLELEAAIAALDALLVD